MSRAAESLMLLNFEQAVRFDESACFFFRESPLLFSDAVRTVTHRLQGVSLWLSRSF